MAISDANTRGSWNSKLGFILAAAGSAVGLGNIWGFPTQVASNGGAAFLFIYLICAFLIGFPVMVAEITIGRKTGRNPVGAFKALSDNKWTYALIGMWGVICGVMILSFYNVIAGWTVSYVFEEVFYFMGMQDWATYISDTDNGPINAVFSTIFMAATVSIILGGVSDGIERATKLMMPLLIGILIIMIGWVLTQEGAGVGLREYLYPDFSRVGVDLVFDAMGQAFFSLSLGMGALITYGSYLSKKENVPGAAAYVTLADTSIAFLAGLLIIPAMYMAQAQGVAIFDDSGNLLASTSLIFQVLPQLFHELGGTLGMVVGVVFFLLLSIAALTSTISLLEVPVSFAIDEFEIPRKKAAQIIGLGILAISLIISFNTSLIGIFVIIFNNIGLPLGGLLICLFLGYYWKTENALSEMENGSPGIRKTLFAKVWPAFVMVIAPLAIAYNLWTALSNLF
ncbi:sodium-dependent transporter [Aliifodinibius sp. S!AR15-10]|uniref:sodium-dependent transporter n=1 Tax=Aliifodinibius sp. S!AR15-10 TaxID=2950437 RepID=UPI00285DA456|nr:sodium-dependent transporter [Aliifodinibius sp. S!AR15-10]MDR8391033.1 sodium-dependent transporter [Aliifodinibius sp. S!AR15-10]